jgi:eukaryotic translation initiation factor 2C
MLLSIDVSHPEAGASRELRSIAAVVGSVDGSLGQYVAHISAQERRLEIVDALEEAVYRLIGSFRERNGNTMPEHIIVYRDGVSDTQFASVLERELTSIKAAIDGYKTDVKTKVSFVICQKAHHTRFVYESASQGAMNLCPGVCVDGSVDSSLDASNNITSAAFNEFYLTSHTALQGTSKPTKYSLIYDEIGIKLSELELLTYWITYTYCRCNKSVSMATPCYYAHWAAKRARCLLSAGASETELNKISTIWADTKYSSMFFV